MLRAFGFGACHPIKGLTTLENQINIIEPLHDNLTLHIETSSLPNPTNSVLLDIMITNKDGLIFDLVSVQVTEEGCLDISAIDNLYIDDDCTPLRTDKELLALVESDIRMIWIYGEKTRTLIRTSGKGCEQ